MVWSNIPGANTHRAAEADNNQQRTEQAGFKRCTYPSVFSTSVQAQQPKKDTPVNVIHRGHRLGEQSGDLEVSSGLFKSKTIGENTVVRFNNQYCPELGAAMALARQEVFGSHPLPGSSDLISSRPSNKAFETFTDVPRLVDTLSLLRRHAPSAPLHHFPHGFGSLRTVRPNMSSPAPGWHYYGENKAVDTSDGPESPSAPRAVTRCPQAHPHQQSQAVQTQSVSAILPPQPQGAWREHESIPVKVPAGSCLDSSAILQQLQQQLRQQQDESQAQAAAKGVDRASVGCQTRQGDSWRVQSEGCMGKPQQESGRWAHHDKAWVPTGTHFLDKQAHEALTPRRPPNSPQGNKCPSPGTRRQKSPGHGRAAASSPARPAWDSSLSKAARDAGSSPGASPTRAQLKKMTASWSPGRRGFVKPELAQNRDNGFFQASKHSDSTSTKHTKQLRQKGSPKKGSLKKGSSKKGSPRETCSPGVPARTTLQTSKPIKNNSGGSIWEGKLAGPSSFLQPILHSQSPSTALEDCQPPGDHEKHDSFKPAKKENRPSSSRGKRHAHKHTRQLKSDDGTGDTESSAQNSPPKIFTLGQSPRGSYVSPLKGSSRRAISDRLALQSLSPQRASSASAQFPAESSQLRPQCSLDYSAYSSRLSIQDSDVVGCSSSEATSEPGSNLSDDLESEGSDLLHNLAGEDGKAQSWGSQSANSNLSAKKDSGAARKLFGHPITKHDTGAKSITSSGLRREVQDSLSELEQLIEQQHRQLIARGILLPEDPSSGSVSASDLDFSNLSLDSGMDRLSRLADSLVEGATPSSPTAQHGKLGFGIPAVSQHLPAGRSHLAATGGEAAPRQNAAGISHPEAGGGSWYSQDGTNQEMPGGSDTHTHSVVTESAWLQSHTGIQMQSHEAHGYLQYANDIRAGTDRQTAQMLASHVPSARSAVPSAGNMPSSVHLSDAIGQSQADTASLCQHSLPPAQRRCSTSQHSTALEDCQSRRTSRARVHHAVLGDAAVGVGKHARASQSVPHATASELEGAAAQLVSELADGDVSASEAEASLAAAEHTESAQSTEDAAASESELVSCLGQQGRSADLAQGGGDDVAQHAQREGLLSDSEEEFENSILAARQLGPVNIAQAATRGMAPRHAGADHLPATFSAQCTVSVASADGQAAAFSTIFRQTPTDVTAAEAEEESQVWEEEMSHDRQSEYSGALSEEPSAAHWADLHDTPSHRGYAP